ncbi:hypothetical protein D9611_010766 [Ephemerocybe angulata]|uniref:Superoxide dismutase n=1 Tax=Ephemerocybe angulata TaxID=980116 RepID=A0A8H5BC49_9AGAR|nr:hypothetical protein D9611_010766 [Tulosesus angulatus]
MPSFPLNQHTSPPSLPYLSSHSALEPSICEHSITRHHTKHHQTYVNALNAAEAAYTNASTPKERIPLLASLKFNEGGPRALRRRQQGHRRRAQGRPLKSPIEQVWGSLDSIQGSGWVWLGYNTQTKRLEIATTPNQDPLLRLVPIIGVDIWEHAFYLQYLNVKPDYLNAIWNVINFEEAEARLSRLPATPSSKRDPPTERCTSLKN